MPVMADKLNRFAGFSQQIAALVRGVDRIWNRAAAHGGQISCYGGRGARGSRSDLPRSRPNGPWTWRKACRARRGRIATPIWQAMVNIPPLIWWNTPERVWRSMISAAAIGLRCGMG
ncbi:MAG: hypothetical protein ACREFA_07450 [Stellaceae bacterium]